MKRNSSVKPTPLANSTADGVHLDLPGANLAIADNGQELVELVWKYFAELISETLIEIQESLAAE